MALIKIFYFLAIASIGIDVVRALGEEKLEQTMEIERRLKLLNKPAIKTIKLDYGIFDCVDIYKQPAFDHPLLKNHRIQLKPTHLPESFDKGDESDPSRGQIQSIRSGIFPGCPNGTVPIRRTTKEDLIREKTVEYVDNYHPNTASNANWHFALLMVHQNKKYEITGAKASIGVFKPPCNHDEASGAQIWLTDSTNGGPPYDGIFAGWMVDPTIYGDSETHFTASWRGKGGGCTNIRCPGYVQVDNIDPLGFVIPNISVYDGHLYGMSTQIYQDKVTKNWWLASGSDLKPMGYWPKELFSSFDDGAKTLAYGGLVKAGPDSSSPPMGSGYNEECHFSRDGFFARVRYQNTDERLKGYYIEPFSDKTEPSVECPNLHGIHYSCKEVMARGFYFMYGGPRGICA